MRILTWLDMYWPFPGGREIVTAALHRGLQARGHVFAVATNQHDPSMPRREEHDGEVIHRFDFFEAVRSRDPARVAQVQRQVDRMTADYRPDVIHLHDVGAGGIFALRCRPARDVPRLVTMHYVPDPNAGGRELIARGLQSAGRVVAISQAVRDGIAPLVGAGGPSIELIPDAVDLPEPAPPPSTVDPPRLLQAGKLIRGKGPHLAIQALAPLAELGHRPRLTLTGEGPMRAELERLAADLNVADRVEFLGWVDRAALARLRAESTLALAPSLPDGGYIEGLCLSALESQAAGRPVVGSTSGGLGEAIADGETGLLIPPDDASALADAIAALLSDPARLDRMAVAARARVAKHFTWPAVLDRYEALYQALV